MNKKTIIINGDCFEQGSGIWIENILPARNLNNLHCDNHVTCYVFPESMLLNLEMNKRYEENNYHQRLLLRAGERDLDREYRSRLKLRRPPL